MEGEACQEILGEVEEGGGGLAYEDRFMQNPPSVQVVITNKISSIYDRPSKNRPQGWSPSAPRCIMDRLYRLAKTHLEL